MKTNQSNKGQHRRLMYLENKTGLIDGVAARVGWVTFSKSGKSIYYRGRELLRGQGVKSNGNHVDIDNGDEYWISGIKKNGSNTHYADQTSAKVDEDAITEFKKIKNSVGI